MRRSKQLTKNTKGVSSLFISIYVALLTIIIISALFYGLSVSHSSLTSYLVNEQNRTQEKILVKALNATANEIQFILINNTGGITVRIRSIYADGKFICDPSSFSGDSYIKPQDSKWIALSPFHIHINFTTLDGNWTVTTERGIKSSNTGENLLSAGNYQEDSNKLYFGPLLLWFNEFKWSNNNGITWNDGWTIPQNPGNVIWRILVEDIDERPIVINTNSSFALIQNSQQPNKIATWQIDSSHPENLLLTPGRRVYLNFSLNGPNKLDYMYSPIPIASNFLTILGSFVESDGSLKGFAQTIPFEAVRIINLPPINTMTNLNTIPSSPTVRQSTTVTGRVVVANSSYPSVPSGSVVVIQYRELGSLDWITILDSRITTGTNGDFSGSFAPPHAGTYEFRATFPGVVKGQQEWSPSSSGLQTITVNKATSTTIINPSTITLGQSTSAMATITPNWATGTVTFEVSNDGGTSYSPLGTKIVTSGSAASDLYTPTAPTSATINYTFRATYSGDSDAIGSTSNIAILTVNKATPTITAPTLTPPSPIILGQNVTASVRVTGVLNIPVTGSITFRYSTDGGITWNILSTQILSGGSATSDSYIPTAASSQFRIRADYNGDTNYNPINSGSASLTVQTLPDITAPTLTPTNPVTFSPITASVTVSGSYGTPTGNANFEVSTDGGVTYNNFGSTKTLSESGTATSDPYTPTSVGTYLFRASYAGNSIYLPLNGSATTTTVSQALSSTTVSLPSSLPVGSPFTITATVTPAGATGTVTFTYSIDGGITYSQLGNPKILSSGSAVSDPFTPQSAGNNYLFNATYSGDVNVLPSTSTNVPLTVYGSLYSFTIDTITNQVAGTPFSITITAKDALGFTVANYNGLNTVSDLTGTITPASTGTFTAGIATVSLRITKSATDVTITTTGGGRSGTSNPFNVDPGALDHFTFANITSPQIAGTSFSITITAQDAYNNTVTSYDSQNIFTIPNNINPATTGTFSGGTWTGTVTLFTAGTSIRITTTGGIPTKSGSTNSFDVIAASVDHFIISSIGNQITNTPFTLTITAMDAYGNIATGYLEPCSITDLSNSINPSTTGLFSNGLYTGSISIANRYSNNNITVTSDGKAGRSNTFNVTGPLDHFNFNPITNQVAGTSFSITITAADSDNNTITSYTGTNTLSASAGTINPTTTGAFINGVRTLQVTLNTTGTSITIITTGASKSGMSNTFAINPAGLDHFTITNYPSSATAGQPFSTTITAYDVYNNVKTNYVGQVYFTSADTKATLPYTITNKYRFTGAENGTQTFSGFQLKSSGSSTITVRDDEAAKTLTTNLIAVIPASIDHIVFDPISSPKTTSTPFTIKITAQDIYGNNATGYSGSATLTASTGSGTINPTSISMTNGQWSGQIIINTAGTGITISATSGGAQGTSNQFDTRGNLACSATINPATFRSGTNQQYTITITNLSNSSTPLSSLRITVPTGFNLTSATVTPPTGRSWSTPTIAYGSSVTISTAANNGITNEIRPGEPIKITFTTTQSPTSGITYNWTTTAYSNRDYTGAFSAPNPQPQIRIQYLVTFSESGLSSDTTGTVATIAGTAKTYSDFPFTMWINASTGSVTYNYSTTLPSTTNGKQYSKTSIDNSPLAEITCPVTIIGTYQVQYYLTIVSTYGTTIGQGWYNAGYTAYAGLTSGTNPAGTGTQYSFTNWDTDALGTNYAQSNNIIMNGPRTASANWHTEYLLSVIQSGIDNDFVGTVVTVNDTNYDRSGYSEWLDSGSTVFFAYKTPLIVNAGKQYIFNAINATSPLNGLSGPTVIMGSYKTQYLQTFNSLGLDADATGDLVSFSIAGGSYSGATSPIGVTGNSVWVDSGATVSHTFVNCITSSLTGKQYRFNSITGPVTNYVVSNANTITASYIIQYRLTVTSDHDSPLPTTGENWFDIDSPVAISITATAEETSGVRYNCIGYTGTGSVPNSGAETTLNILMNAPSSITWIWIPQYLVSFNVNPTGGGTIIPSMDMWYNNGATDIPVFATPSSSEYVFSSWTASPTITIANTLSDTTTMTVNGPGTVTANFSQVGP